MLCCAAASCDGRVDLDQLLAPFFEPSALAELDRLQLYMYVSEPGSIGITYSQDQVTPPLELAKQALPSAWNTRGTFARACLYSFVGARSVVRSVPPYACGGTHILVPTRDAGLTELPWSFRKKEGLFVDSGLQSMKDLYPLACWIGIAFGRLQLLFITYDLC